MANRELCMAAVVQGWEVLEFVSEEMKGNRELCTAAVAQDWLALKFVSEEMQGDRELFTAAVALYCRALQSVSDFIDIYGEVIAFTKPDVSDKLAKSVWTL